MLSCCDSTEMKPYYQKGGITIYYGDCLAVLPTLALGDVHLICCDPPYGIAYKARKRQPSDKRYSRSVLYEGEGSYGDEIPFDPSHILKLSKPTILWGANNYANKLPGSAAWLIWDKKGGPQWYGHTSFSDCEMAWTNIGNRALMFRYIWNGIVRQGEDAAKKGQPRLHPAQKPIALMNWCLAVSKCEGAVLDPYMGSGATLLAAKRAGLPAIGIELEQNYCDVTVERLEGSKDALRHKELKPLFGLSNG
jgi:site-specific DNA-methyltransferase (adenine-specific)